MKKNIKLFLMLMIGIFIFSGCTKSFCSTTDVNNIKEEIRLKNENIWRQEAEVLYSNAEVDKERSIQEYIAFKTEEELKKHPQACITTTTAEDELTGASIERKSWKDAFKIGLFEGLLVYPISMLFIFFVNLFGGKAVAQVLSIIIVTILVRLLTFLLTMKTNLKSQKLQEIQPKLREIQEKVEKAATKAEREKYSMQLMDVYKKNNINPLSSMLMPFVSFPIFIGVWGAVKGTLILISGSILGVKLGVDVKTQIFAFNIGAIGLFILMAASQFVSMRLSTWLTNYEKRKKNEPKIKPSQNMNLTYNIMFGMILIAGFALPGAMIIYWIVGALFSIAQTFIIRLYNNRKKDKDKNVIDIKPKQMDISELLK